jgi:hypothetical protein
MRQSRITRSEKWNLAVVHIERGNLRRNFLAKPSQWELRFAQIGEVAPSVIGTLAFTLGSNYQGRRGICSLPLRLRSNDCATLDLSRDLRMDRSKLSISPPELCAQLGFPAVRPIVCRARFVPALLAAVLFACALLPANALEAKVTIDIGQDAGAPPAQFEFLPGGGIRGLWLKTERPRQASRSSGGASPPPSTIRLRSTARLLRRIWKSASASGRPAAHRNRAAASRCG